MNDTIEVHIDIDGTPRLVGLCRYVSKSRSQTSVFEYADSWLDSSDAFSIDPENLPLSSGVVSRIFRKFDFGW